MTYENKLAELDKEIKILREKIFTITKLYGKIQESECFTPNERQKVWRQLEELQSQLNDKEASYDMKIKIFHEKIESVRNALNMRQMIIDDIMVECEHNMENIFAIFMEEQSSLEKQLKKSEQLLEQT